MPKELAPRVSVVVPFLDGANFIREAVDSVFAQSFQDWELILVDDGSSDESAGFAFDLAQSEARVSYASHPERANLGPASSRALGSSVARGENLLFLDHDDLLYPDALGKLVRRLDAHPRASAVFAGVRFWAFDPSLAKSDTVSSYGGLTGLIPGRRFLRDLIVSDSRHPAICSTLFRRDAYAAARDASPAYPGIYEDTAILFQLLARGDVYAVDEPVASYRLHRQSLCHRAKQEGSLADHGFSEARYHFLRWVSQNVPMDIFSRGLLRGILAFDAMRNAMRRPR